MLTALTCQRNWTDELKKGVKIIECLELQYECNNVDLPGSMYALGVDNVLILFLNTFFWESRFFM